MRVRFFSALVSLALALPLNSADSVGKVPVPPGGALDPDLTKVATDRAKVEMEALVNQLQKDPGRSDEAKRELKRKISRLKIAIYTTAKPIEDSVAFYGKEMSAAFAYAQRNLLADLHEVARAGRFKVGPDAEKEWTGKSGLAARWARPDGSLEIDIEDHLIDPRDGKISKRTVVMVTAIGE